MCLRIRIAVIALASTLALVAGAGCATLPAGLRGTPSTRLYSGLRRNPLAQAVGRADRAIKLPPPSVAGKASAAVSLPDRSVPATATDARARTGIRVIYPGGVSLTAQPVGKARAARMEAGFVASSRPRAKPRKTNVGVVPFLDGRTRVSDLVLVNGRRTQLTNAGTQGSAWYPSEQHAVPASLTWVDNGVWYLLSSNDQPIERLVAIARSIR